MKPPYFIQLLIPGVGWSNYPLAHPILIQTTTEIEEVALAILYDPTEFHNSNYRQLRVTTTPNVTIEEIQIHSTYTLEITKGN